VELTIICGSDGGVAVFSPGPDRELGTADDLVF